MDRMLVEVKYIVLAQVVILSYKGGRHCVPQLHGTWWATV